MTKSLFLPLCGIILIFVGCKDLVQNDFEPMEPMPVVNSFLLTDSLIKVHVSIARGLDDQALALIENANISLFVNEEWKENLSYLENGWYTGNTVIQAGIKYHCKIES